jgi:TPR repeat protein
MRRLLLALGAAIALAQPPPARGADGGLADLDDPKVQYELGMSQLTGQGGEPRNPEQAIEWLRKAAMRGHTDAQVQLGICAKQGVGVPSDPAQALAWFRRAAEQGNARGQLQLALAYRRGEGVAADPAQASAWLRKAAENGHPKAQLELGIAYRDGHGVDPDPAHAAFWLVLAADAGSPAARMLSANARNQLDPAQRAELDRRLEAWKREHPAPSGSDS